MKLDTENGGIMLVLTGEQASFIAMLLKSGLSTALSARDDNPSMVKLQEAIESLRLTVEADERNGDQDTLWNKLDCPVWRVAGFSSAHRRRAPRKVRTKEEALEHRKLLREAAAARSLSAAVRAQQLTTETNVAQPLELARGALKTALEAIAE